MTKGGASIELEGLAFKPTAIRMDRSKRVAAPPGVQKWLKIERSGRTSILQVDKHIIAQETGVQLRDLRLLDPVLATSYPSAILARDSALVLNLEFIKCIITTDYALVLNPEDENAVTFIEELQRRLAPQAPSLASSRVGELNYSYSSPNLGQSFPGEAASGFPPPHGLLGPLRGDNGAELFDTNDTPFELRVLEVALDVIGGHLERQAADLEATAHPALDALTREVSTGSLERVRRVKSRMVRLKTRVETIREVLQKYLDDDSDMKDLHLSAKADEAVQRANTVQARLLQDPSAIATPKTRPLELREPPSPAGYGGLGDDSDDDDVNEVEMLLEAVFIQVDNTHNKLQTLHEYIDDTEDYINIELDSHRNQLIQLELLLTAGMLAMALVTAIAGLFGMNLFNKEEGSYVVFLVVTTLSCAGATAVFIGIVLYCRYKKLMCY